VELSAKFEDDFCEGNVLGGVDDPFPDPLPVFTLEVDLLVVSAPLPDSLELLEALSDLKLLLDRRLRSWRKDGIPGRKRFGSNYDTTVLTDGKAAQMAEEDLVKPG